MMLVSKYPAAAVNQAKVTMKVTIHRIHIGKITKKNTCPATMYLVRPQMVGNAVEPQCDGFGRALEAHRLPVGQDCQQGALLRRQPTVQTEAAATWWEQAPGWLLKKSGSGLYRPQIVAQSFPAQIGIDNAGRIAEVMPCSPTKSNFNLTTATTVKSRARAAVSFS